jgi:uncharacterized protein YqeY
MSLKDRITEDMKAAMRAKDSERLGTIRMITAAIKQREVDERITLDDAQVLAVLEKMIKTRKESIVQFASGGRDDLSIKDMGKAMALVKQKAQGRTDMAAASAKLKAKLGG